MRKFEPNWVHDAAKAPIREARLGASSFPYKVCFLFVLGEDRYCWIPLACFRDRRNAKRYLDYLAYMNFHSYLGLFKNRDFVLMEKAGTFVFGKDRGYYDD